MTTALPVPVKGAYRKSEPVIGIVGAIIDSFIPIVGTSFSEILKLHVKKRLEKSSEILCEELRNGNINILNDQQFEEFVPIAYRYFEAARSGERVVVLKKFASFLGRNIILNKLSSDKFLKYSDLIKGLDNDCLRLISIYINQKSSINMIKDKNSISEYNEKIIIEFSPLEKSPQKRELFLQYSNILVSRGFLLFHNDSGFGGGPPSFWPSPLAEELSDDLSAE